MAITKIQSESLNLADNYDFTGTVTGAGGGLLLQIVSFASSGSTNTTSGSYVDTALSATITPSSASNKVLIIHSGACEPSSGTAAELTAERNGTLVANKLFTSQVQGVSNNAHFTFLDSPASTSALLYKIKLRSSNSGVNSNHNSQNPTASIILMEISA